jgi:predicted permease
MREWIARLRDWFRHGRLDRELAEELRFHRQELESEAEAAGADRARAQQVAARRLGNLTRVHEAARERWTVPWLDHLQRDVRLALRGLRRSPGFAATVVVTLALGIGANATMFDVVDRLMFRPLAYLREPATVHRIYWQWSDRGSVITGLAAPYARYLDLRKWTTSFSELAGFSERDLAVGLAESSRERRVGAVSASFFDFFEARPALGRFFVAEEDVTPRGADVAVLSYAFWQTEFGGRDVRGEVLQVGDVRATIIGVAPRGFAGVNDAQPPAVYLPITTFAANAAGDGKTYFEKYQWSFMNVMVRRRAGVTVDEAAADASQAFRRSWEAGRVDEPLRPPLESAQPRVAVSSVRPGAGPNPNLEARTALWVGAVAALVLLIACANVVNLFLARALSREHETAVRLGLGVGRARLMAQSVVESLVLALLAAGAALLVAQWWGAAVRGLLTGRDASLVEVLTDGRTAGATAAMAVVVGLLAGMAPSLLSSRGDLTRILRGGACGGVARGARLRAALLVTQTTLSFALLVGAALFVRSLDAVKALPLGYDPDRVLLVNRIIRGPEFEDGRQRALRQTLLATAQSLAGVESAAWVSSAPFVSSSATDLFVPGSEPGKRPGVFTYQATTPDYFRTMGTRILRGRGLSPDDREGAPDVAIVSESMARALWPGVDAIGQCFRMRSATAPCTTVVGIAEDVVQVEIAGTQRYHYYLSIDQFTRTWGNGLLLRLRGDPGLEGETVRKALQRTMTGSSYLTVRPLRDIVRAAQRPWWTGATLFGAFAILALLVAAVGLYGAIGYGVAERKHELGVRVAVGARRSDIVRLVVGQGVRYVLAGTALGTLVALLASRWVQPLLFRQSATDPGVLASAGAAMVAVAFSASALPAFRAARVDPMRALRSE